VAIHNPKTIGRARNRIHQSPYLKVNSDLVLGGRLKDTPVYFPGPLYRLTLFERGVRLTLYRPLPEGRRGLPSRPPERLADCSDLMAEADQYVAKFLVRESPGG
jgi:hypothetical protein